MLLACTTCQKHLGLYLDEKLSFYDHINAKISKANKGIGIIKRLSNTLPRNSLLIIYKSFIKPHLDYCDIIYDQPNNEIFCTKIERTQYNPALAITGAIEETSQTKLYKELVLDSLKFRRWFRLLCTLFKVKSSGKPEYLLTLIPTGQHSYNTRSLDQIETHYCRTDTFKKKKIPYTIVDWNKLGLDIQKSKSYAIFRNDMLKTGWPNQCSVYRIHNPMGLKLLTRYRLGLSYFNENRFNHNFQSCINLLCNLLECFVKNWLT